MKGNENYRNAEFSNIRELDALVLGMDTAHLADVIVEEKTDKKHMAVVNDSTQKIEAVVSDRYCLISHRKAFEPFVNAMRNFGIGIKGKVTTDSGRAYIDVRFDDDRFKVDVADKSKMQKGDVINFGFRLCNSYDKTSAFGIETYALRLVCLNGMIAPVKLKAIREVHVGKISIVSKTLKVAIESLMSESEKFADIVSRARQEIITEQMLKALLASWKLGEKNTQKILSMAKEIDELNGYSVYNLLTNFISHVMTTRESTKEKWHKKYANAVLNTPIQTLIAKGGKAE